MAWLIENVCKPWHPTIIGIIVVTSMLYFRPQHNSVHPPIASDYVAPSDCQKIKIGMSEQEVISILRRPGEELTPCERQTGREFLVRWHGNKFQLIVSFNRDRTVTLVEFHVREFGC